MADVRPYVNGHSETNSLHVHTYKHPADPSELLCIIQWDRIEGSVWHIDKIKERESIPSHKAAMQFAHQFAAERGIPLILEEDHSN